MTLLSVLKTVTCLAKDRVPGQLVIQITNQLRNFWISLDSAVPKVHEQMRKLPDVVRGIETAIPIFHDAGIFPSVNLGINRLVGGPSTRDLHRRDFSSDTAYLEAFYQRFHAAFDRFFRQMTRMGFTIANTCYPMSIEDTDSDGGLQAVYAATAGEAVVRFTREEKPERVLKRISHDPRFFSLWQKDLRYYAACGYFNGRKPPALSRLAWFTP
jgi:hypothetical protein